MNTFTNVLSNFVESTLDPNYYVKPARPPTPIRIMINLASINATTTQSSFSQSTRTSIWTVQTSNSTRHPLARRSSNSIFSKLRLTHFLTLSLPLSNGLQLFGERVMFAHIQTSGGKRLIRMELQFANCSIINSFSFGDIFFFNGIIYKSIFFISLEEHVFHILYIC